MGSSSSAMMHLQLVLEAIPDSATADGALRKVIENATTGARWAQGTGSGQADRVYYAEFSFTSGQTRSFDLLAAGSLVDILGQAIDADELKAMAIIPTSGSLRLEAPATGFISLFSDATDLLNLPSRATFFDFGNTGIDVTTNSKFDITEATGGATAGCKLAFIVAQ
jgi:hypothetical protein